MSLIILPLVLLAIGSSLYPPASAFADTDSAQLTVSRSESSYKLEIKGVRGRLAGELCGGFKNWRCAPELYCERRGGTIGVCVRKKT
jgi:hypothetical protein